MEDRAASRDGKMTRAVSCDRDAHGARFRTTTWRSAPGFKGSVQGVRVVERRFNDSDPLNLP